VLRTQSNLINNSLVWLFDVYKLITEFGSQLFVKNHSNLCHACYYTICFHYLYNWII